MHIIYLKSEDAGALQQQVDNFKALSFLSAARKVIKSDCNVLFHCRITRLLLFSSGVEMGIIERFFVSCFNNRLISNNAIDYKFSQC